MGDDDIASKLTAFLQSLNDAPVATICITLIVLCIALAASSIFRGDGNTMKRAASLTDFSVGLRNEERGSVPNSTPDSSSDEKVLHPSSFKDFKVLQTLQVSHNTKLLRFEIPFGRPLGLPIGRHISVKATIEGNKVVRPYTPTSRPDQRGYFDLLIKSYEHGKMSSYLHSLKAGSTVEVRGPVGRFKYQPGQYSCIGLIAGGTGLTPCLQVVRCVLLETNAAVRELDKTKFVLFFQNRMEEDILLRDELDELSRLHSDRLSIVYFLSNATSQTFGKATNEVRGYIGAASIQSAMSPAACPFVCICGPSGFNDSMKAHLLAAGHTESGDSPSLYIW